MNDQVFDETTLGLIKPGPFARREVGEILTDIESSLTWVKIIEMWSFRFDRHFAEEFYREHRGKAFFAGLIDHMVSGPSLALLLDGPDAIRIWRDLLGPTDPQEESGGMRHAYGVHLPDNALHGSASEGDFIHEIRILHEIRRAALGQVATIAEPSPCVRVWDMPWVPGSTVKE